MIEKILWTSLVTLFVLGVWFISHVIYNPTDSVTRGYYFTYPSSKYKVGDIIEFCVHSQYHAENMHDLGLPYVDRSCPYNSPYLIKQIVAMDGDEVKVTANGVLVNGYLHPDSIGVSVYNHILLNPIKNSVFRLKPQEFFVLGKTKLSYDSRYFGVIRYRYIHSRAILILATNRQIW